MVPAVILAAGLSSRMGRSKALLPLSGTETFLSRLVKTFLEAGVNDVVIVLGHDADSIQKSLRRGSVNARVVLNAAYETGQFSSVLKGLDAVDRPGVAAMLLTLVDIPLVRASTIRAVLERYRATGAPIVRPVRGEQHGHPVLIDRSLFDQLRRSDPSAGAKPVVRAHVSPAGDVPVDDDGAFIDIDTPEDYARHQNQGRADAAPVPSAFASLLRFAIAHSRLVEVTYNGRARVAEPHDYGVMNGSEKLLAYQLFEKGQGPHAGAKGWRLFETSRMSACVVLDETFPGSRGHEAQHHVRWDELFVRVT